MNEKPEFNWYTELDKAIKSGPTQEKYFDLRKRAKSWVTCACGHLCKEVPKDLNGMPEDLQLFSLGLDFAHCINFKQ